MSNGRYVKESSVEESSAAIQMYLEKGGNIHALRSSCGVYTAPSSHYDPSPIDAGEASLMNSRALSLLNSNAQKEAIIRQMEMNTQKNNANYDAAQQGKANKYR